MSHSTELRQRLEVGIQELESEVAKLRAALAALDAGAVTTSRASRLRPGRAAVGEYEVVPAGKLASLLSASDIGLSTTELAQRTHGNPDQVLELLKELEEVGGAHRSGARRSTRWHAGAAAEPSHEGTAPDDAVRPSEAAQLDASARERLADT